MCRIPFSHKRIDHATMCLLRGPCLDSSASLQGALEAPLMRKFTYDCGHQPEPNVGGSQYPLTATHSLQELTWHGDVFFPSVREATKLAKLEAIKLHLYPGTDDYDGQQYYTGYEDLRDLELPALRALNIDYFEADPPFVLHVFTQFPG